jgi:hypothetical protein
MANNLFISYDLYNPGQNYEKVGEAIKSLGNWAKVQKLFWYVNSNYSSAQARDIVGAKMDGNDSLIVIDASNGDANWKNLSNVVSQYIRNNWNK